MPDVTIRYIEGLLDGEMIELLKTRLMKKLSILLAKDGVRPSPLSFSFNIVEVSTPSSICRSVIVDVKVSKPGLHMHCSKENAELVGYITKAVLMSYGLHDLTVGISIQFQPVAWVDLVIPNIDGE